MNAEPTLELGMSVERTAIPPLCSTDLLGVTTYRAILADPPWPIKWQRNAGIRTRELDYPTMPISEMCLMPVKEMAHKDGCTLFMWTTNAFLPEALGIVKAWGFTYEMLYTWCKNNGMGGHPRCATEHMIIAVRGTPRRGDRHDSMILNWGCYPLGKHSEKPEAIQTMIEKITEAPRLELFARRKRAGWHTWGNEVPNDVELVTPNGKLTRCGEEGA
jgi:N6-adenosine-specific RNA methylase IME4